MVQFSSCIMAPSNKERGANLTTPHERHREAPVQRDAKPRPCGRVPGRPLHIENSRFSRETVAEATLNCWSVVVFGQCLCLSYCRALYAPGICPDKPITNQAATCNCFPSGRKNNRMGLQQPKEKAVRLSL